MKICHIYGYELLKDKTQSKNIKNIEEMIKFLVNCEVFIDQKKLNGLNIKGNIC